MIANYHGHTVHCKHGTGTTREHIEKAISYGLEEIAITEHVPIKGTHLSRIDYKDFDKFINELNDLKEEYKGKIKVLSGLECEYIPEIFDDHLYLKEKYDIDYLVLGHHFSNLSQPGFHYFETKNNSMVDEYIKYCIMAVQSGHFKIFAHPDIFLNKLAFNDYLKKKSIELFEACAESGIVMEINANGLRNNKGYPNKQFWTLANDYDFKFIINADSHAPHEIFDRAVKETYEYAKELGIEITERLDFE